MTVENELVNAVSVEPKPNAVEAPPNLLNGKLKPVLIGERIWVYQEVGKEEQLLEIVEVTGFVMAKDPKDICAKRNQPGVSLRINERPERKLLLTASHCDGGQKISFPAIYHIDHNTGTVVAFSRPTRGQEDLPLLTLEKGALVLIPILKTKTREGGIIITSDKELKNSQNRIRIEGHLKIQ